MWWRPRLWPMSTITDGRIMSRTEETATTDSAGWPQTGSWRAAADMGNLWAMDRLARLECRKGHLQEAAGLWEQAAQMHYPAAGLHLALYIYGPGCEREDVRQYRLWLEQASQDGSARASCELAKQNLSSDPFLSGMLLARAEEQNQGKFNLHVYRTIRELQQKLVLLSDGVM